MALRGLTIGYLTIAAIALGAYLLPLPDNARGDAFFTLALLCVPAFIAIQPVRLFLQRHPAPLRQLASDLRTHWRAILWTGVIYASLAVSLETFTSIKKSIPAHNWFYADPFLIDLDRTLLFGFDAWQLSHNLLAWTTPFQVWVYNGWHFVHVGLAVWIAFAFDEAQKIRFTLLLQFVWLVLGGLLATLLSSVGPVMVGDFYDDARFDPLIAALQERAPSVLAIRDTLVATVDDPTLISGISAMPSIHVAVAVCAALWLQRYRVLPLTVLGWSFAAAIYIGSVHLGWHYLTDGLVSAPLVLAAWWLTGRYVGWLETRDFTIGSQQGSQPS